MKTLQAVSLSHQTASLEWRQALQLSKEEAAEFMQLLRAKAMADGVMLVTTCNRTEVYYESAATSPATIQEELLQFKNLTNPEAFAPLFTHHSHSESTLLYLLEVGLGLRSQVIGDRQIIGQLKDSYQHTTALGLGSPLLHQAVQTLFRAHKRVHNETNFRYGAASVGYAALERITDFIPRKDFSSKRLLIIGTGQMGTDVTKYASSFGFTDITLTNRTDEKAAELAARMQLKHIPYANYISQLATFDVVISSVSGGEQLMPAHVGEATAKRVLLDLSVPQSIHPSVGKLAHTVLVNIDQITSRTRAVLDARKSAVTAVQNIIEEETIQYANWLQNQPMAKTINELKGFFASVLESELEKHLDLQHADAAKAVAKATLDRLIRRPAGALRATEGNSRQLLLESLHKLFQTPVEGNLYE